MSQTAVQILIVEDQEYWREGVFGESLQELGFTVFSASTKEKALQLLDERRFDLAIVDINLTEVTGNTDGLLIVERIQQTDVKTPIIVVSGTEGGLRSLQERGFQVFALIRKDDFDLDEFITQAQKALAD